MQRAAILPFQALLSVFFYLPSPVIGAKFHFTYSTNVIHFPNSTSTPTSINTASSQTNPYSALITPAPKWEWKIPLNGEPENCYDASFTETYAKYMVPGPLPNNTCSIRNGINDTACAIWDGCNVAAEGVQFIYFPNEPQNNKTRFTTFFNRELDYTFTSPSVYLMWNTMVAWMKCDVSSAAFFGPTMTNLIQPFDLTKVSMRKSKVGISSRPTIEFGWKESIGISEGLSQLKLSDLQTNCTKENESQCIPQIKFFQGRADVVNTLAGPYWRNCPWMWEGITIPHMHMGGLGASPYVLQFNANLFPITPDTPAATPEPPTHPTIFPAASPDSPSAPNTALDPGPTPQFTNPALHNLPPNNNPPPKNLSPNDNTSENGNPSPEDNSPPAPVKINNNLLENSPLSDDNPSTHPDSKPASDNTESDTNHHENIATPGGPVPFENPKSAGAGSSTNNGEPAKKPSSNILSPDQSSSFAVVYPPQSPSQNKPTEIYDTPNNQFPGSIEISGNVISPANDIQQIHPDQPNHSDQPEPPRPIAVATYNGNNVISAIPGTSNTPPIFLLLGDSTIQPGQVLTVPNNNAGGNPIIISLSPAFSNENTRPSPISNLVMSTLNAPSGTTITPSALLNTNPSITPVPDRKAVIYNSKTLIKGGPVVTLPSNAVASYGSDGVIIQYPGGSVSTISNLGPIPTKATDGPILGQKKNITLEAGSLVNSAVSSGNTPTSVRTQSMSKPPNSESTVEGKHAEGTFVSSVMGGTNTPMSTGLQGVSKTSGSRTVVGETPTAAPTSEVKGSGQGSGKGNAASSKSDCTKSGVGFFSWGMISVFIFASFL
ncbi:hypothetical protein HYFRA_00009373 [Hymenoscyphus fraxineus]|uniref:Uncharacterized protein n=1 Tax=Hymenoscyphus fraxineus TaxID=746836 RepID=A0A9N9PX11_9HELO|nr:hypothetical protein HYFRA_00009373 [Hymenoscyphus fraxineus]